jgi:hypothetical protein
MWHWLEVLEGKYMALVHVSVDLQRGKNRKNFIQGYGKMGHIGLV